MSHYVIGGFGQGLMFSARRLGRWGSLIDNRVVRALLAGPQDIVRSRVSYGMTRSSRAASLGYLAVARKPG